MRTAAALRPPLARIGGGIAALWLAVAGCGAAGGGGGAVAQRGPVRSTPVARTSPTTPVMVPATPAAIRPLEATGAPPAPEAFAGGTAPAPVHLRIAAIGVDTALERLGLNGDGTIEVPSDPNQAGWYTNGPAPGEQGPAVILGHLDSATGPAVFWRLSSLRPGSEVTIAREDGSSATFVVERVASFPVDHFPTDQVYGATSDPELRLITCGGTYNVVQRRYLNNVVVFAALRG